VTRTRYVVAGIVAAVGVTAWAALQARHERRIRSDPERHILSRSRRVEETTVRAPDGTNLAVRVTGPDQAPTLVFAHGWAMASSFWDYQIDGLRDAFRIVVYDQRGHGASDTPASGDHSLEAVASDLSAVVEATVPEGRMCVVVGHSMGAMGILAWASRDPSGLRSRVAAAVLVDTAASELVRGMFGALAAARPLMAAIRWLVSKPLPVPSRSNVLTHGLVRVVAHGDGASPAQVARTEHLFLDCPADVRAAFGASLTEADLLEAAARLAVPSLVVAGDRDRLTPLRGAEKLAAALPVGELVVLDGAGHQTPLERPDEVNRLLRRFVGSHLGRVYSSDPIPSR
jgi:pimeloyl-ACP methyl ester carboxylesterase